MIIMNDFLQHFTHFGQLMTELLEKLKPKESILVQEEKPISVTQDDGIEGMEEVLIMHMASMYNDDMMLTDEGTGEKMDEPRTVQFQRNQHMIKTALDAYIAKNGKLPSNTTLSKITGLSKPTIDSHLKAGAINLHFRQELSKLQLLSSDLLVSCISWA